MLLPLTSSSLRGARVLDIKVEIVFHFFPRFTRPARRSLPASACLQAVQGCGISQVCARSCDKVYSEFCAEAAFSRQPRHSETKPLSGRHIAGSLVKHDTDVSFHGKG